jgi:hypothetical protein
MRTDKHEDMTRLIVDFYNFANTHNIYIYIYIYIYMQKTKEITNYEYDVVPNDQIDKTPVACPIFIK